MIRWIVGSSLKSRILVVAVALLMMFVGVNQLRNMPVDVVPEFSRPYVEIQTEALGLSSVEVESLVTVPLEADMLNGVAWVEEIRSESIPGMSSIVLIFEPGTNVLAARQMVQERLVSVFALPGVSKPPVMLNPLSSTSRIMNIGLFSKELSLIETSVLARWTIKPRLMGVPGVANVSIWGQRKRQLQVLVDPLQLKDQGVTLDQVIKTTGNALWVSPLSYLNASSPGTGGFIDTPNQRLGIRHILPISTPDQLAQVMVDGTRLSLGEVADVVETHQPLIGDAVIKDASGLMLVVEKFPWANTLEVTRGVEKALELLQPGLSGLEMDSSLFRPATFVEMAMDNFATTLLISTVLVVVALLAFLYEWRSALICSVAILLSLLAAALVLYLRGTTMNMMVLTGIMVALAAVLDDAIIDVENFLQRLRQHHKEGSNKSNVRIILDASMEMRRPVVYATLIIVLAIVPILFMEGLSGMFVQPIVISYGLALLASMFVALTVTPALSMLLLPKAPLERRESFLIRWLRSGYQSVFSRIISKPRAALVSVVIILLVGIATLPLLRNGSLIPTFKERDVLITMDSLPGSSHPAMNRIISLAGRELRSIPGVKNVSAHVGRAVMSDDAVNINSAEIWVSIDPGADYEATLASIEEVADGYPGLDRDVNTYLKERIGDEVIGADEDIVVRVYGENFEVLRSKAKEVQSLMAEIDGIVDPQVEPQVEEPTLEIQVDLNAAKSHGLKPGDVRRAAATLMAGIGVGNLFEEQKVFDVVVWGKPQIRQSLTSINELLIDSPSGELVPLSEVADVRIVPNTSIIKRDSVSRFIDVNASLRGRTLDSVSREVERRLKEIEFPLEYRAELLGGAENRLSNQKNIIAFAITAALLIFLVLQAFFGSWRMAAITFFTLPTALAGGVVAMLIGGGSITISSLVGLLVVFGIAARNSITLISHYQHLEYHDGETFGPELVSQGTRDRFAPILTTAAVIAVAFLPFTLFGDIPGHEVFNPMAVVILGGLVTSTLFILFAVPAMYLLYGSNHELSMFEEEGVL